MEMSLGAVYVAIFQSPSSVHSSTANYDEHPPLEALSVEEATPATLFVPTLAAFRGVVLIPFSASSATTKDLYEGLEHRLNKYAQVHKHTIAVAAEPKKQRKHRVAPQLLPASYSVDSPHPQFSSFCTVCNGDQNLKCFHSAQADAVPSSSSSSPQRGGAAANRPRVAESDVTLSSVEYPMSRVAGLCTSYNSTVVDGLFPRTKGTMFSSSSSSEALHPHSFSLFHTSTTSRLQRNGDDVLFVDALLGSSSTTEDDENSVLYMHAYFSTKIVHEIVDSAPQSLLHLLSLYPQLPKLSENGITHRPDIGRNHCSLFFGSDVQAVRVCLVVNGNEFPFAVSSHHTCRDLMVRLEQRHSIRVLRFYELETGASILPCEFIVFVLWKLKDGKLYGEVDSANRGIVPPPPVSAQRKPVNGGTTITDNGNNDGGFLWLDDLDDPSSITPTLVKDDWGFLSSDDDIPNVIEHYIHDISRGAVMTQAFDTSSSGGDSFRSTSTLQLDAPHRRTLPQFEPSNDEDDDDDSDNGWLVPSRKRPRSFDDEKENADPFDSKKKKVYDSQTSANRLGETRRYFAAAESPFEDDLQSSGSDEGQQSEGTDVQRVAFRSLSEYPEMWRDITEEGMDDDDMVVPTQKLADGERQQAMLIMQQQSSTIDDDADFYAMGGDDDVLGTESPATTHEFDDTWA